MPAFPLTRGGCSVHSLPHLFHIQLPAPKHVQHSVHQQSLQWPWYFWQYTPLALQFHLAFSLVLILIAVLRSYSTTVAAITATMPVMVPLAFWIMYAGEGGDGIVMTRFLQTMVFGLLATLVSLLAMLYATRAGWGVTGIIAACYGSWAIAIAIYQLIARLLSARI